MRRSLRLATAGLALGLLPACDQAPGQPDDPGAPARLSDFSVTPGDVRFDDLQEGDSARVTLDIQFEAEGDVAQVAYAVVPQFAAACVVGSAPRPAIVSETVEQGPGRVRFSPTFAVARDQVGLFDVTVAAFDSEGRRSERGVSVVRVTADPLGPPALSEPLVPSTVALPETGNRQFTVAVTVTDPDGPRDIDGVTMDLFGQRFALLDDGESGDGDGCDGRYALTLQLAAGLDFSDLEGEQEVVLTVTDRAGNTATETATITFTAP
jgi:hypothetical protein